MKVYIISLSKNNIKSQPINLKQLMGRIKINK